LPPELDEALRSGRCTSPRTLYELAKLHKSKPEQVKAIVGRGGEITRSAVASFKKAPRSPRAGQRKPPASRPRPTLACQVKGLCERLESLFGRMTRAGAPVTSDELATVRRRLELLAGKVGGRAVRTDRSLDPRLSVNGRQRKG
jgi:ParB family chromosome partitioning protein